MSLFRFVTTTRWLHAALMATLLALASLLGAAPALADPPGRVGRLAELQGTVWFYSPDDGDWIAAVRNRPITDGDRLATDAGARAEVRVGSSTLRLDASSELEVLRLDDDAVRVQLHSGSAALRVTTPNAAREFELVTDEGRFLPMEPGSYRIDRADATSTATAWRGSLRYEGDGQAITLDNGQRADFWIEAGSARYNLTAPDRDAFADWVASSEREDERTPVPRTSAATAAGSSRPTTARCGSRAWSSPAGRRTATATGASCSRGAGPGSTTRPGASRRSTTAAGCSSAGAGAGRRAATWRGRCTRRRWSPGSAARTSRSRCRSVRSPRSAGSRSARARSSCPATA
jgi:hypothetical protein